VGLLIIFGFLDLKRRVESLIARKVARAVAIIEITSGENVESGDWKVCEMKFVRLDIV